MKKLVIVCVLAVVVFVSAPAGATILGTVDIQNHTNGLSDQSPLYGGGLTGGNYYTGVYSWTNAGGTGLGTSVPDWGFCIELPQGSVTGWQNVVPLDEAPMPAQYGTPMGLAKANYIRELWGRDFATIAGNAQIGEAFGAAVWEIIYETDSTWDVTGGAGFYATGIEQAATANLWLSQLNGDANYFASGLVATSTLEGQDFLVQIPEPATMAILGLGGLLLHRRK